MVVLSRCALSPPGSCLQRRTCHALGTRVYCWARGVCHFWLSRLRLSSNSITMRLVHLSRCKDAVLEDGCIDGTRIQRRGFCHGLDVVMALAMENDEDPCCPHFGDPVELPLPAALQWCSYWHICWPSTQRVKRGGVYTVYLVPDDHPEFDGSEEDLEDFGFDYIDGVDVKDLDHRLFHLLLEVEDEQEDAHLHVAICTDSLPVPDQRPRCSCGSFAATGCRHDSCGRCCSGGCTRHPRPAGEPGSCLGCCGIAAVACPNTKCGRCCSGCTRHSTEPAPGEPGSCRGCSGIAAVDCANHKCGACCGGCSRHPRQPAAGEPGSCRGCDAIAAVECPNVQCARCCPGCSRHPRQPEAGEPGSCRGCDAIAAVACTHVMCARCCPGMGCSRHAAVSVAQLPGQQAATTTAAAATSRTTSRDEWVERLTAILDRRLSQLGLGDEGRGGQLCSSRAGPTSTSGTPSSNPAAAAAAGAGPSTVHISSSSVTAAPSAESSSTSASSSSAAGGSSRRRWLSELDEVAPQLFHCPLSLEVMQDPVVAADGYTYERSMIAAWLARGNPRSPLTNEPMESTALLPNRSLKSAIHDWGTKVGLVD